MSCKTLDDRQTVNLPARIHRLARIAATAENVSIVGFISSAIQEKVGDPSMLAKRISRSLQKK
jgi:predicted HicB family RNase H-like nuclease